MLMSSTERGIAVRFSVAFLLLAGIAFSVPNNDYGASSLWQRVKAKYGSKAGLKENAEKPLMTDTPMTNVEGSIKFNAKVQCPSRREGILITFLPVSGNEYRLIIRQDLDLDGTYEKTYDSGISVSGVCNSGIISCNPSGSWQNCEYYYWFANQNGYVELKRTNDPNKVGACFCSNSSCGVNSLDKAIVDYIVGGIAQAIMNARHDLAVSYAGFDLSNFSAKLYVQDKTKCAYPNVSTYGEVNPTNVYENQIPPDGYSYLIQKGYDKDTDSPYYLIKQASQIKVNGKSISYPSRFTCSITNDISFNVQSVQPQKLEIKGVNCVEQTFSFPVRKIAYSYSSVDERFVICVNNRLVLYSDPNGDYIYSYSQNIPCSNNPDTGDEYFYTKSGIIDLGEEVSNPSIKICIRNFHGGGSGYGKITLCPYSEPLRVDICKSIDSIYKVGSDNCSGRIQGCVLKNEWICDRNGQNCIQTIREGVKLGISPQKFCYQTSSQVDSYEVCADGNAITVTSSSGYNDKTFSGTDYWFYIKREYECPPDTIDIDLSRAENVISSVSENSGSVSYTDFGQTHSIDLSSVPKDTCSVAVCTVKLQTRDTSVFSDKTNRAQTSMGTTQEMYERRVCEKDTNGNWKCPIYSGEVKVEDCSCSIGLDSVGFSVSISVLGSVVEASKDIICSSSPP